MPRIRPHGQLRRSQVITTFGPGALVDLPRHSVMIGGLEHWDMRGAEEIVEPRLVDKIRPILGVQNLVLKAPPPADENSDRLNGVMAWEFPNWCVTQETKDLKHGRSRYLLNRSALEGNGRFRDPEPPRKNLDVIPIRFVRACPQGHINDIDWPWFAHNGKGCGAQLYLDERGTGGDLTEIFIRCACEAERCMIEALQKEAAPLGMCRGDRPWLGKDYSEACKEKNRLLIRSASNAYFPQNISVISIPEGKEDVSEGVAVVWDVLQAVTSPELLTAFLKVPRVKEAVGCFDDSDIMEEIRRRQGVVKEEGKLTVKEAELRTLLSPFDEIGKDAPSKEIEFYARKLPRSDWDKPEHTQGLDLSAIQRVLLVHRLREVVAQVGFTRFEYATPDIQGELDLEARSASLAGEVRWVPAYENRGEGIFLAFDKKKIDGWVNKAAIKTRMDMFQSGMTEWLREHQGSRRQSPGAGYILLHSLSHLLITAVSLECGYPSSSIRERIYAGNSGYGILLYTASPDAEGTLGGLVDVGRRIGRFLKSAIELATLCSNDPICSHHRPDDMGERRFLHGAACHGCVLIAETSCEQHNDFLDRTLVVGTVESAGAEFFAWEGI